MNFNTNNLPEKPDYIAPDGSEVRLLVGLGRGDMAHFTLPPKRISKPVAHKNVEEIWYVVSGAAKMWRKDEKEEGPGKVVDAVPGTSLSIPPNVRFQFRTVGDEPFKAVAITMPPWPGEEEAVPVEGKWQPDVS